MIGLCQTALLRVGYRLLMPKLGDNSAFQQKQSMNYFM